MGWNNSLDNPRVTCGVRRFLLFANILVCARLFAQESKTSGFADLFRKPPKPTRRLGARSRCFCCLDPIPPTEGGGRENQPLGWVKPRPTPLPDQAATAAHTSSLVSDHTRVSHVHARPHCPTTPLAMVLAQSIVRARTRARGMGGQKRAGKIQRTPLWKRWRGTWATVPRFARGGRQGASPRSTGFCATWDCISSSSNSSSSSSSLPSLSSTHYGEP